MKAFHNSTCRARQFFAPKLGSRWITGAAAAAGLLTLSAAAFADPPTTMAPPIQSSAAPVADSADTAATQDSVFNWKEVPENQHVPLRRAVFDQGGYQLYDTVGETIVVPFTDNNLYVMKFAVSDNGTTYFVNSGAAPVLYVPKGGYLENAAVPGAKWYPFSDNFHPAQPVFLGVAPSYTAFVGMGWYPDMICYGGYYGYHPFLTGGVFLPTIGLAFIIGGHHYSGWAPYHHYYFHHPAPYHVTIVNRNIYHFGGRPVGAFRGAGHPHLANRSFGSPGHTFRGTRGVNGAGHTAYAHRTPSGSHTFRGAHAVSGGHSVVGGHSVQGGHSFQGGGHSFSRTSGHSAGGGGHRFSGGHAGGDHVSGGHGGGGGHEGRR